jgi:acyl-CoA hydrolase
MTQTNLTPSHSRVEMTELVLPQHTNALGTVFGGVVMSWVDIAAAISAQRHCRKTVVTASIDALHFLAPIKLGWVVNIKAQVNHVWHTSCEVGVTVSSENPTTGEAYHTASAYVTMVAIDDDAKAQGIPPLILTNEEEKKRSLAALERRQSRLELKQKLNERGL